MIPLFKVRNLPTFGRAVQEVCDTGIVAEGEYVQRFERELAKFMGVDPERVVAVNSGTSALALASRIVGAGEIVTSPLSCFATFSSFVNDGSDLMWVDINPETGNIDPGAVRRVVHRRTRAILAVHWGGMPFDYSAVRAITPAHIPIICDAAHAMGATYESQPIADVGDFVIFSHQAVKHLHTSDGGTLVCKNPEDAARARKLRWFGLDRNFKGGSRWEQDVPECGFKYHMNNVSAAIGLEQLPYLDEVIEAHRGNSSWYDRHIDNPAVKRVRRDSDQSACWLYSLLVENPKHFQAYMAERDIATDVVHVRCDRYSAFERFSLPDGALPGVTAFSSRLTHIPVGWWVAPADRDHIVKTVNDYAP